MADLTCSRTSGQRRWCIQNSNKSPSVDGEASRSTNFRPKAGRSVGWLSTCRSTASNSGSRSRSRSSTSDSASRTRRSNSTRGDDASMADVCSPTIAAREMSSLRRKCIARQHRRWCVLLQSCTQGFGEPKCCHPRARPEGLGWGRCRTNRWSLYARTRILGTGPRMTALGGMGFEVATVVVIPETAEQLSGIRTQAPVDVAGSRICALRACAG
jgi:hypothetical protein